MHRRNFSRSSPQGGKIMRRHQSFTKFLITLSILLTTVTLVVAEDTVYQAGFVRWRGAEGQFSDWELDGVRLATDGTLRLDRKSATVELDPYWPSHYYGHYFYNGGSFLVGAALGPVVPTPFSFKQAIASWNADTPPGTWVETLIRARLDERWTKWYNLGVWAADTSTVERHSVNKQSDDDGKVAVDTLVVTHETIPANAFQLKLRLFSADGALVPSVRNVSVAFSTATVEPGALTPGDPALWDQTLAVPECSQMVYPDGGNVWCSPTSTSMVLAYWIDDGAPCEPRVRDTVAGVYDWLYDGHGNWPFNTAYAATQKLGEAPAGLGLGRSNQLEGYVARFTSLAQAEEWIDKGVPVICSIAWERDELTGAPVSSSSGHLVVLVGFDADGDPVVNDPAAPSDDTVQRTYIREEFEPLWLERSGGTVYLIYPSDWSVPDF
jgi:hypothetical protein